MTTLEKQSERKRKALYYQVTHGEKTPALALQEAEEYHDNGKMLDKDYEPLAEWLESLLEEPVEEEQEEPVEETNEETEEAE